MTNTNAIHADTIHANLIAQAAARRNDAAATMERRTERAVKKFSHDPAKLARAIVRARGLGHLGHLNDARTAALIEDGTVDAAELDAARRGAWAIEANRIAAMRRAAEEAATLAAATEEDPFAEMLAARNA